MSSNIDEISIGTASRVSKGDLSRTKQPSPFLKRREPNVPMAVTENDAAQSSGSILYNSKTTTQNDQQFDIDADVDYLPKDENDSRFFHNVSNPL